jgi:hypothetical protein
MDQNNHQNLTTTATDELRDDQLETKCPAASL